MSRLQYHTDPELISLLRQGDHSAFEQIYSRHWSSLYAYCYNRLRSRVVSEELVQEVFLALWNKRHEAEKITSLSGYLFMGVKYRMLNEIKAEIVRKKFADDFTVFTGSGHSHVTEERLAEYDLQKAIQYNVDQLPLKCRLIFQLSRNHHQSIKDISLSLNLSPKTVENQLSKALKFLRLSLKEFLVLHLLLISSFLLQLFH
ncbi:MAG: RNA polymerase sigma-70 factor [Chryseolinea sp.]